MGGRLIGREGEGGGDWWIVRRMQRTVSARQQLTRQSASPLVTMSMYLFKLLQLFALERAQVRVLLHRLLLGHALHAVPCVPLGARLHLHSPRLRALYVSDGSLRRLE